MRSAGDLESVRGDGFRIGMSERRRATKTKDIGAEQFWAQLVDITAVCKEKKKKRILLYINYIFI